MKYEVVIGANYGDEAKGTTVARIARNYKLQGKQNILGALTNGGAQRGHTVYYPSFSHTFKHFSSATFEGATSVFLETFILNPMAFVIEYEQIRKKDPLLGEFKSYFSMFCKWSTPFDIMANQAITKKEGKFNSCGMGIWETIKRSENIHLNIGAFNALSREKQIEYLKGIKRYYEERRDIRNVMCSEDLHIWDEQGLMEHFIDDVEFFIEHTIYYTNSRTLLDSGLFDVAIFENGQGLLLSDNGTDDPDTTPSITGCADMKRYLRSGDDATFTYVTRTYLTRHGNPDTFDGNEFEPFFEEENNQFNEFQGGMVYGNLDTAALIERIKKDQMNVADALGTKRLKLAVTHCDVLDREKDFKNLGLDVDFFGTRYIV